MVFLVGVIDAENCVLGIPGRLSNHRFTGTVFRASGLRSKTTSDSVRHADFEISYAGLPPKQRLMTDHMVHRSHITFRYFGKEGLNFIINHSIC